MRNHHYLLSMLVLALGVGLPANSFAQMHDPRGHKHDHGTKKATSVEEAVAVMLPVGESGVTGVIRFTKQGDQVKVVGKLTGLTPGEHAFHVHEYGDLTDLKTGSSAGSHYNPTSSLHGPRVDGERHVGDLGNITADDKGVAEFEFLDSVLQLNGPHSIVGRSLVVHVGPDKFTQPVGDAGGRVTVGVIGVAAPAKPK